MTEENGKQDRPRSFFFDTSVSMRKYILRMGLISLVPSIIIALLLAVSGIADEGSGPDFEGPALVVLPLVLIAGPAIETLLLAFTLWLLSFFAKRKVVLALVSALIWAGLHSLAAPAWGLVVFWPFFVFSCSYLAWRERSWGRAVWVTFCIHVFQNVLPGIAIVSTL
jgi:hypothetical protein